MNEVELCYRRKESIEIVRSQWLREDDRYVYLACGRYVKARIISMTRVKPPVYDDDEE